MTIFWTESKKNQCFKKPCVLPTWDIICLLMSISVFNNMKQKGLGTLRYKEWKIIMYRYLYLYLLVPHILTFSVFSTSTDYLENGWQGIWSRKADVKLFVWVSTKKDYFFLIKVSTKKERKKILKKLFVSLILYYR